MLADASKLMKRARRAAKAVKNGTKILARLEEADARALMVQGAEEEIPSVSKIAPLLLEDPTFDPVELSLAPVKTTIGLCVRAILAEEGYKRIERGVRTDEDDKLFSTGSVYAKEVDTDDNEIADGMDELIELLATVGEKMLSAEGRRTLIQRLDDLTD